MCFSVFLFSKTVESLRTQWNSDVHLFLLFFFFNAVTLVYILVVILRVSLKICYGFSSCFITSASEVQHFNFLLFPVKKVLPQLTAEKPPTLAVFLVAVFVYMFSLVLIERYAWKGAWVLAVPCWLDFSYLSYPAGAFQEPGPKAYGVMTWCCSLTYGSYLFSKLFLHHPEIEAEASPSWEERL